MSRLCGKAIQFWWKRWGCVTLIALTLPIFAEPAKPNDERKPAQAVEIPNDPKAAAIPTDLPADPPPAQSGDFNHWLITAVVSPVDYWIAGKYGVLVAYIPNPNQAIEVEYLRGSFGFSLLGRDLGNALEQRVSVQSRYFLTESFNYHAGLNYNFFEVELKDSYTSTVQFNPDDQDFGLIELATVGIQLGVGNRWYLENGMEVGVDWIQIAMPLIRIHQYSPFEDLSSDTQKVDEVNESIRRMRDNPRFALVKIQAGISF